MNEKRYRQELDRVRLTPESKEALKNALIRREKKENRRHVRFFRTAVAVAAVICLLGVSVGAAAVVLPVLRSYYDSSAGYEQSATTMDRSVTADGWTLTLTDCVGDSRFLYFGVEVTVPEGVSLDHAFSPLSTTLLLDGTQRPMAHYWKVLEDDDSNDSKLHLVLWSEWRGQEDTPITLDSAQNLVFSVEGMGYSNWNDSTNTWDHVSVCDAVWDFGNISLPGASMTKTLYPNVTVSLLDTSAQVTKIEISPIGVCVWIEGDGLKGHHDKYNNGYCIELPQINLYDANGMLLEPDPQLAPFGIRGGSGCSGGTDTSQQGALHLVQTYGYLLDMDKLDHLTVCGVEISLQ